MSTAAASLEERLRFTLGDRLAKALNIAGITSNEMGDYLGMSRTTISNYTNDRTDPKLQTLRLWALRTGVPLEWLRTGRIDGDTTPPSGEVGRMGLEPMTGGLWVAPVIQLRAA